MIGPVHMLIHTTQCQTKILAIDTNTINSVERHRHTDRIASIIIIMYTYIYSKHLTHPTNQPFIWIDICSSTQLAISNYIYIFIGESGRYFFDVHTTWIKLTAYILLIKAFLVSLFVSPHSRPCFFCTSFVCFSKQRFILHRIYINKYTYIIYSDKYTE